MCHLELAMFLFSDEFITWDDRKPDKSYILQAYKEDVFIYVILGIKL